MVEGVRIGQHAGGRALLVSEHTSRQSGLTQQALPASQTSIPGLLCLVDIPAAGVR